MRPTLIDFLRMQMGVISIQSLLRMVAGVKDSEVIARKIDRQLEELRREELALVAARATLIELGKPG